MEISTAIGLLFAFGAIAASLFIDGGDPAALINISSIIIVMGCSLGAALMASPLPVVLSLPALLMQSFKAVELNLQITINQFVELADQARREGLLSLEEQVSKIDNGLIKKGIMLIVDGVDPAVVRDILETDNDVAARRHRDGIGLLEYLGTLAPAMGMLGTVLGLVGVLRNLSDTESIGPSIAVAFLTTLYGVILANLLWGPISKKLKEKDKIEMMGREIIVEGVLSIQAGENPRIVREKLESFLSPKLRGQEANSRGE